MGGGSSSLSLFFLPPVPPEWQEYSVCTALSLSVSLSSSLSHDPALPPLHPCLLSGGYFRPGERPRRSPSSGCFRWVSWPAGQVQGRSTAQTRGGVRVPAEARDSLTDTHSVPYTRAVSVLIQESNTLARYEHPSRAAIMLLWPQDHSIVLPFHHIVLILSQEAVLGSCWQPRAFSPRKRASGCKCHSFAYCVAR